MEFEKFLETEVLQEEQSGDEHGGFGQRGDSEGDVDGDENGNRGTEDAAYYDHVFNIGRGRR